MPDAHHREYAGLPTGGIHAGVFGFTKSEWVLRPLASLRVERFLLLEMPGSDRARRELASKGIDIDVELGRAGSKVEYEKVDLWNPGSVAGVLIRAADALESAGQGPLYVNISCGPNPWCVGATLSSMFAAVQVYHVDPRERGLLQIPAMRQERPLEREMKVLAGVPLSGWISGTRLKAHLAEEGYFPKGLASEKTSRHLYLQTSLRRLLEWRAVIGEKRGARLWYAQGPCANALLSMFPSPITQKAELRD
jgi:hypothetical protein